MRWETISATSSNEIHELWHEDRKLLTLTLHPFSNTARVESEEEKRVFLIRKEGFRRNKTVLRNEYGIKIGELGHDSHENFIDVNNERFYYTIHNNPLAELVLYKESKEQPVISCKLSVNTGNASMQVQRNKNATFSYSSLLMALCWYMFLPVATQLEAAVVN
jgi:hypothetical protein